MNHSKLASLLAAAGITLTLSSCGNASSGVSSFVSSSLSSSSSSSSYSSGTSSSLSSSPSSSSIDLNPIGLETGTGAYPLKGSTNADGSLSYSIFVRSFCDSDGDGIGDFKGAESKGEYLKSLGVSRVWLLPINSSSSYHGYDVDDYFSVESDYGTIEDFTSLLTSFHALGIDVILDLVLNHSSKNNAWFKRSYNDYIAGNTGSNSKKDWYNWSESSHDGYSSYNGLYYEARFDSSMPDFNFDSAGVQAEFKEIMDYWLSLGVDGFRLDAVRYYYYGNTDSNVKALSTLVDDVKSDYPDVYFVGENWITETDYYAYYASKVPSFFNFSTSISSSTSTFIQVAKGFMSGDAFSKTIANIESHVKEENPDGFSSYFLSNHDQDRSSKSLTGYKAKLAASIYLLLPGTPYVYYGEEIGLKGTRGANDGSDALRRLPMIWSKDDKTGECSFPEKNRLDLEDDVIQVTEGASDLEKEPLSLTNHYKKVGDVRNEFPFIQQSTFKSVSTKNSSLMAYTLEGDESKILVVHNLSNASIEYDVSSLASSIIDSIDTSNLIPSLKDGKLGIGGYSTVILKAI